MNWFNTSTCVHHNDVGVVMNAVIEAPDDPVFAGLSLTNGMLPWTTGPYDIIDITDAGNGTLLASSDVDGTVQFVRFNPDIEFYDGAGDRPAGYRTYIGNGNDNLRDTAGDVIFNYYNFTSESKQVYFNEIRRMTTGFPTVVDQIQFDFFTVGSTTQKTFQVNDLSSQSITINSCEFDHAAFSLITSLPITITSNSNSTLIAAIQPDNTRLYESTCQLTYQVGGESKTFSGNVSVGLFLDNDSELAYNGHLALDAYNACKTDNPNSVATKNNLAVLYRLLGEIDVAEQTLTNALSKGLNAKYGYSGIKMNMGVVKSDQGQSSDAHTFYDVAMKDVSSEIGSSVIGPQVYYNMSWEFYISDKLSDALSNVNETISNNKVNDYLKAKAYVLRGAIYFRQGDKNSAGSDFQQAINIDPDGPIGRMAEENLQITSGVADRKNEILPTMFVLKPNYPNPFNPETMISFGLPRRSKVELLIYNIVGQKVRTLLNTSYEKGWHNINWDGTNDKGNRVNSGLYLLQMNAGGFESKLKMTFMK